MPFHLKNKVRRAKGQFLPQHMALSGLTMDTIHRNAWRILTPDLPRPGSRQLCQQGNFTISISIPKVSVVKNLVGAGLLYKNIAFQFGYILLVCEACVSISLYLCPLHRWLQQLELASLQMMPDAPSRAGSFSSLSPTHTQTGDTRCPPNSRPHPSADTHIQAMQEICIC